MSFTKYAASVAAILAVVSAADDPCKFDSPVTITAADAVSTLGACSTISGDVVFATGAAQPTLALPGVQEIDGAVTYTNDDSLQSFQAPMLKKISGKLLFDNLTHLGNVQLNSLRTSGDVSITGCASLSTVVTGPQYSSAGVIELANTYLTTMGGFGNLTKINGLKIGGNPLLSDITMNIATVQSIDISANEVANNGLAVKFDNLTSASDSIVVRNATNVSFASLQMVTNNLEMIANNIDTFSAPNLTNAGGLYIISNPELTNISLPLLTALNGTTGAFQIANNSKLAEISGYPQLSQLAHDVVFTGSFKKADLSSFKRINGAMTLYSSEDISDTCNTAKQLQKSQVVLGKESCTGSDPKASGTTSTNGGSGTSGSGSSSSSSAAAVPINIPALPALGAGLGAALLQFFLSF